jgi:AbiV family abortive infection protein
MTRQMPPQRDLARLTQAALFNARDLLADARTLAAAESWPRAHALAVLALEEVGKGDICTIALSVPGVLDAADFWKSFYNHPAKLHWAIGFLQVVIREPAGPVVQLYEQLGDESKAEHLRKLRGLYVDYESGRIIAPAGIGASEAQTMIDAVQELLDFQMGAWVDAGAPARLLERLAVSGPDLEVFMTAYKEAAAEDLEQATLRARDFIHEQMRLGREG